MSKDFIRFKSEIETFTNEVKDFISDSILNSGDTLDPVKESLKSFEHKLNTQEFTVGVVGVFNSGKSTFLNALLGRELLSSFILPETAALTKLVYSETEGATVTYWSKEEWASIRAHGELQKIKEPSILEAIEEQEHAIGAELNNLITTPPRTLEVPTSDLIKFSAKRGEHAAFVKEIELRVKLDFCKDNIAIIDTPGLNDPVQLRELITRNHFLPRCDLIIFLVSASQAFTKFDDDFLIDQAEKGHLNKLFLVINKVDQLRKGELTQVIDFAKKSAVKAIHKAQVDSQRDDLEVFPISAAQALYHRDKSLKETPKISLEETGLPAFENRLQEFLFKGERAQEVIGSLARHMKQGVFGALKTALSAHHFGDGQSIDEMKKSIVSKNKDLGIAQQELQLHERSINMQLKSTKSNVDALRRILISNIQGGERHVSSAIMSYVDEYLESRNGISAALNFENWCKTDFVDHVRQEITAFVIKETEKSLLEFKSMMKDLSDESIQRQDMFQRRLQTTFIGINGVTSNDMGSIVIDVAIEIAIAQMIRTMLPGIIALVSAKVAAMVGPILLGPIGIVIMALITGFSIIKGGNKMKEKLRSIMQTEVPKAISEVLSKLSNEVDNSIAPQIDSLLEKFTEMLHEPGKLLIANVESAQRSLAQLEEDLRIGEDVFREKLRRLDDESHQLEVLQARLDQLLS